MGVATHPGRPPNFERLVSMAKAWMYNPVYRSYM
jgi:hypothetical protein